MKRKPWMPADCVEWVYERAEGDIVVYARNALEALETIREHGFATTDPKKLKQGETRLLDVLMDGDSGGIQ